MIIKIRQTASNTKQTYEIDTESSSYNASLGSLLFTQDILLVGNNTEIKGTFKPSALINYIPFSYLFKKNNFTRRFDIFRNNSPYGTVALWKQSFLAVCYVLTLNTGKTFHCYYTAKGSFSYISVYDGEKQVALVETYLNTEDYKYTHKLYVLNDYNAYTEAFIFFVLYYSNYSFSKRFHMTYGSTYTSARTFSKHNDKYNPDWREKHFPNENYFGKFGL